MEEKIVALDETDLDGIVGGALNQSIIGKHHLEVDRRGCLNVQITPSSGTPLTGRDVHHSGAGYTGPMTESGLKKRIGQPNTSISFKTTTGEFIQLSPKELKSLFS